MVLNHFAVSLFRTQHPQQILVRPGGPAVDQAYLDATLASLAVFLLLFVALLVARVGLEGRRAELMARRGRDWSSGAAGEG